MIDPAILADPAIWTSFIALAALEIVLGVDNIVFIALLVDHLPEGTKERARRLAVFLALFLRIALLLGLAWIIGLAEPIFGPWAVFGHELTVSWRDILLLVGGLFLIYKATDSMHEIFTHEHERAYRSVQAGFWMTVLQALLIDLVFSFDSVMTAIGITEIIPVIVAAMVVAMIVMVVSVETVSHFVTRYPTLKTLAISFILMIGVLLIAEAFGIHVPRGYIFFAMGFAALVETLNILAGRRREDKRALDRTAPDQIRG